MSGTKKEEIIYDANGNVISDTLYPVTDSETNTGTGTGTPMVPPYVYTPGSSAPTNGSAMDYATWLQGDTKYQAEQYSLRQQKAIEDQRQKSIIDANNAYKTGLALYGANAERKASMGLSESGYSEYLTGKAYATQRADINAAESLAAQRKDEVLYQEELTKRAADSKYYEDLIKIGDQQNTNYTSIYDAAINGASIESIIQDGRWSTLTPEQQTTIRQVTTANSLMSRINAGESLESIKSGAEWNTLTLDQQTRLESLYNTKTEADTTAIETNYSTWLDDISTGKATLEQVKALSGYEKLTPDMKAALEKAESDYNTNKVNEENEANSVAIETDFANWIKGINDGNLSLSDIQNLSAFKALETARPDLLEQLQAAQDAADLKVKQGVKDSVAAGSTVEEIESELGDNPNKEQIIADAKTEVKANLDKYVKSPTQDENNNIDTSTLDDAFNKGYITLPEYQNYYEMLITNTVLKDDEMTVEEALSNEQAFKTLKDEGKLSYEDYADLTSKLFSKVGENLPSTELRIKDAQNYRYNFERTITVNGKTYNIAFDKYKIADENTTRILNAITKNTRIDGKTAKIGDVIYTYITSKDNQVKPGWYPATSNPIK